VRKSTLMVTSLFAASALTVAWNAGQLTLNEEILLLPAEGTSNPAPTEVPVGNTTETATPVAEPTTSPSTSATTSPAPGQTATSAPAPSKTATSSAPAPSKTAAAAPAAPAAPVTATVSSDPITYKYGTVQISMTNVDGAITGINMLQGDASNGRDSAYRTLIDATIQNQGTNYGNISGATFTVDAFKKAVDSALLKF
jgi:uncharacterized protein with FMN-binding domain